MKFYIKKISFIFLICIMCYGAIFNFASCNNRTEQDIKKELFLFEGDLINYSLNISLNMGVDKIFIPIITRYIDKSEVVFKYAEGININDLTITGEYSIDNFLTPIYTFNNINYYLHKIELQILASDNFDVNLPNREINSIYISINDVDYCLPAIININSISDAEQRYINPISGISINDNKIGAFAKSEIIGEGFYSEILNTSVYDGINGGSFTIESIKYSAGYFDIENTVINNFYNDNEIVYNIQDSINCNVLIYDLVNYQICYDRTVNEAYKDTIFLGDTFVLSYHTSNNQSSKQLYDYFLCGYQQDKLLQYLNDNFEENLIEL